PRPGMLARRERVEHTTIVAQHLDRKGQLESGADRANPETAVKIALAQPRIDERRFPARVCADKQTNIRFFDARDRRVEQVSGAALRVEPGAVLTTIKTHRAEAGQELLQREHCFGVAQIAGNRGDALARNDLQPFRNKLEGLAPIHLALAVAADIRAIE